MSVKHWSVWLVSLASVFVSSFAAARPNCDVPWAPAACDGGIVFKPPRTPVRSLQQPMITGGGLYAEPFLAVYVKPQAADETKVTRLVIHSAPSLSGPWSIWSDRAITPSSISPFGQRIAFYNVNLRYLPPLPTTCFRAKFLASNNDYSPWSVAKCMSSTPVATAVQAQVGFGSVTIGWTDAAQHDRYVYVETADPDGTHTEVKVFGGNGLTTGTRVVSIARPYRQPSVCVRIWAAELLPGLTGSLPGPDFSDSSPMNAVINPSPRVCFETPGI